MPNTVNLVDTVVGQPESTGQTQHGTITEPQQPEFQPIVTPRFAMNKGGMAANGDDEVSKEEAEFQAGIKKTGWYKEYVKEYGEAPDLNTTEYDYRKAWKAGVRPERDPYDKNKYHWGSSDPKTGEMLKSKDHPTAWKEEYMRKTGKNPDEAGVTKEQVGMAKGGQVRSQTQRMLKKGGMMQEGGTVDPVSGNDVPVGAMQEEVRDDIPAQLSEGEFVFPADVVRFIGLERLMMMRQAAKEGLGKMEDMGQMSNADEATEEDDGAFESQIDEIMGELGEEEDDVEMAVGGMATEPAAMAQTQQALAQDQQPQQPQVPTLTEEQLAFIQQTASGMKAQQMQVSPEQQSMPTEGLTSAAIIKNNLQPGDPEKTQQYLSKIDRLIRANRAIITRHNDTVVIGFVKQPGVVDPIVFSNDAPEKLLSAVVANMNTAKSAGISKFESDKSNPLLVDALIKSGYPVKDNGNQGWSLTLE
jgi:hypothetical protein